MKSLAIDFARRHFKHRRTLAGLSIKIQALGLLGMGGLILACWQYWMAQHEMSQLVQRVNQLEHALNQPLFDQKTEPALAPAKIQALNTAIQKLNLPWRDLFSNIEQATPKEIALLSLEPDATKNTLTIFAEAANPEAMLDYVNQLKRRGLFQEVRLVKHEISKQDVNAPYRFQLETHWKEPGL